MAFDVSQVDSKSGMCMCFSCTHTRIHSIGIHIETLYVFTHSASCSSSFSSSRIHPKNDSNISFSIRMMMFFFFLSLSFSFCVYYARLFASPNEMLLFCFIINCLQFIASMPFIQYIICSKRFLWTQEQQSQAPKTKTQEKKQPASNKNIRNILLLYLLIGMLNISWKSVCNLIRIVISTLLLLTFPVATTAIATITTRYHDDVDDDDDTSIKLFGVSMSMPF